MQGSNSNSQLLALPTILCGSAGFYGTGSIKGVEWIMICFMNDIYGLAL